jgi:hypothetical protein
MKKEFEEKQLLNQSKWLDGSHGRTKVGVTGPCHVLPVNGVHIYGERRKR